MSIQAHADYVSPTTSVASQAAQYSVMDINSLIKADLWQSSQTALLKLACGAVLCGLSYRYLAIPNIEQYIGVMFLLFCLPPAANIVALETHYQGTGTSAKYIASGTIISCVVVSIYGLLLHVFAVI